MLALAFMVVGDYRERKKRRRLGQSSLLQSASKEEVSRATEILRIAKRGNHMETVDDWSVRETRSRG